MSFIVNDDGRLEVGPDPADPGDPSRKANADFVAKIAFRLEMDLQMFEAYDAKFERLEARVTFLEQMLTGVPA